MLHCHIKQHCLYMLVTEDSTGFVVASEEFAVEAKTNRE